MSREKRPDVAIQIARATGMKLKLAAKVDAVDKPYFEREVAPLLGADTEFIGEINEHEKTAFLGGAEALLFPIDWLGTVRAGDDRGDGLRNAGAGLRLRLGARSRRSRRHRAHRLERGRSFGDAAADARLELGASPRDIRASVLVRRHGARLSRSLRSRRPARMRSTTRLEASPFPRGASPNRPTRAKPDWFDEFLSK